jgi:predicted RNA-binding Zn-ribbon protein involved in translation (DUF1610 family)
MEFLRDLFSPPNAHRMVSSRDENALINAVHHLDVKVRRDAITALGEFGSPNAGEELITAILKDTQPAIRKLALTSLLQIADRQPDTDLQDWLLMALNAGLSNKMDSVRQNAASALSECGCLLDDPDQRQETLDALNTALKDKQPAVQAASSEALQKLDDWFNRPPNPEPVLVLPEEQITPAAVQTSGDTNLCPFCGSIISAQALVCRFCGRSLPNSGAPLPPSLLRCPHCAEVVLADAHLCRFCSQKLK